MNVNKLFEELKEAENIDITYGYEMKKANQIIRAFFESKRHPLIKIIEIYEKANDMDLHQFIEWFRQQ